MSASRRAAFFCSLLGVTSCFGAGLVYKGNQSYETDLLLMRRGDIDTMEGRPSVTKADVLRDWGPPDDTETQGESEVWTYYEGLTWIGAMPMLLVSVPLIVPTGRHDASLHLTDGVVTKAVEETNVFWGCRLWWDVSAGVWHPECSDAPLSEVVPGME